MSIDSMRFGGGRCPPLLVGGLLIACIMMICNWWTLSSTNLELLRQIDELNEQIKISVEERDQYATQRGVCDKQLKECTDDARTTHVKLSQVDENLSMCNKEMKSLKQLNITKTATLEALRIDKQAIAAQLSIKQDENKKLEEDLKVVKNELEKVKLSLNAPPQKQTPILPIVHVLGKQTENKTAVDAAPNPQMNAPPNANNVELPGQDLQDNNDKDNSKIKDDAAEVNDGNNALDPDLNLKLISDIRVRETK